jgi:DNA-dependent RNA polymerase auxiliary subunit epsilon
VDTFPYQQIVFEERDRRDKMIYKVIYQESSYEVPIRERSKRLYLEAESQKDVRRKLSDRGYNIELIQPLDEAHLEYEKQSEDFKLENV